VCVELSVHTRRRATLRLRAGTDATTGVACSIVLSPGSIGPDAVAGVGTLRRAWCARSGSRAFAVLAVSPDTAAARWFAKLDVGDGWFDGAGWREFPAVPEEANAPAAPHAGPLTTTSVSLEALAGVSV
jgi:hypothetical protein